MRVTGSVARGLLVDVHSHVYTPRLVELLRKRSSPPCISSTDGQETLRTSRDNGEGKGSAFGPQFWQRSSKVAFMDRHRIDASIVSVADPCLDSLPPEEAVETARVINEELESWCRPPASSSDTEDMPSSVFSAGDARTAFRAAVPNSSRIRAFGVLPFAQDVVPVAALTSQLEGIHKSASLQGAILSTKGLGKGLDDERLEPLWECAERLEQPLFVHPHGDGTAPISSADGGLLGPRSSGAILPLALGLPYETAAAAARLIVSGVLDRYPRLKLIIAHSGGALPMLSSRLAWCVSQEADVCVRLKHDARYYLGQLYFDALCYGPEELELAVKIVGRAHRYRRGGPGVYATPKRGSQEEQEEITAGSRRFLFGTDHPFFPPLASESSESSAEAPIWQSASTNLQALHAVASFTAHERDLIAGSNASTLFGFS